ERPAVELACTRERRIDTREHVLRHHIREKAEPPPVDPQQRHTVARNEPGCEKERAVTADRNYEIGARADLLDRYERRRSGEARRKLGTHDRLDTPRGQMRQEQRHGFLHARVRESADERANAHGKGHGDLARAQVRRPDEPARLCSMDTDLSQARMAPNYSL